jgi:hypothetical protein
MSEPDLNRPKVYVSAVICEDIVREQDTSLLTAIRITHAFTSVPAVVTQRLPDGTRDLERQEIIFRPLKIRLVVSFYCESAVKFLFIVRGVKPDGSDLHAMENEVPVEIPYPDGGAYTLNITFRMSGSMAGVYWLQFHVDGEIANKIMLAILHPEKPEQLTPTE